MTSSRHLAGMMMAALVPLTLAATPVEAQMNDFVDGAVTIDLGAIPGGGYGQTVISPMDSAPPSAYSGALRVPGPNRPRSQLFVTPSTSTGPLPKLRVTRAEPAPSLRKPTGSALTAPKTAMKAPEPPKPSAPAPKAKPAAEAPAPLEAAPPPAPAPMPKEGTATQVAEAKAPETPAAPAAPAATAEAKNMAPPPPPVMSGSAAVPPPPPPPATTTPVPTPPAASAATETASLTTGEDGRLLRVEFDESESKLPDGAKPNLAKLAEQVKDKNDIRLQLLAYAGGEDLKSNRARRLSLSRALSVRSFLIESGIRSTRIDVRALGDKTSDDPKNRVDVTLAQR